MKILADGLGAPDHPATQVRQNMDDCTWFADKTADGDCGGYQKRLASEGTDCLKRLI
ncbi:hypothetical protein [Mesorhizobium sp. LNHC221B00]|uniref:hypothetical protein n=1 Tax=Mesorhizobium sp. LNHC221B00 TaxID=1287233 RepID=UPI001FD87EBF|nr:hypothetical protein [Mesorhizobium sp. LNHC221B00]